MADPTYGEGVAKALGIPMSEVPREREALPILEPKTSRAAAVAEPHDAIEGRPGAAPPAPLGFPARLRRALLLAAGVLSVALGLVGVVVPMLPTTPFLLLAAACFLRSSERMHRWLLGNRLFGEYLRRYRDGQGLPLSSKVTTLVLLWATLGASALLAVPPRLWWVRLVLGAVGLGVTIHILRIKTRR